MKTNNLLKLMIALALFSVFYGKTIFARTNIYTYDPWLGMHCIDQVFTRFSEEKNPPSIDQCREYCHCLFSYDEKTEVPFTLENIPVEHIDSCKAKYLKLDTDSDR